MREIVHIQGGQCELVQSFGRFNFCFKLADSLFSEIPSIFYSWFLIDFKAIFSCELYLIFATSATFSQVMSDEHGVEEIFIFQIYFKLISKCNLSLVDSEFLSIVRLVPDSRSPNNLPSIANLEEFAFRQCLLQWGNWGGVTFLVQFSWI